MNDNANLKAIPEELLESIAGGVLTDDDREAIRRGAQICKDNGWSSETAYGIYAAAIASKGTPDDLEDLGEIKSIIKQVYGEQEEQKPFLSLNSFKSHSEKESSHRLAM